MSIHLNHVNQNVYRGKEASFVFQLNVLQPQMGLKLKLPQDRKVQEFG